MEKTVGVRVFRDEQGNGSRSGASSRGGGSARPMEECQVEEKEGDVKNWLLL